ncbi:hypothetical protein P152DRAFT_457229 [Eremomyces bilateralis CBS 781.70]|uniref:Uncharacterized protein n=1 Tax=Eremomyces bilateralis CBS 781.70 TaxID=1392243 RepID=A0A6G1G7N4_9PEZI|nr:uncharacterized protein P152DRAFT_457229 [Eremomyces bilateralis CBS 781.70]KAF1813859.1 hypothetical protein P152DRAFT_457229 [Eremomyces bilateralis CBS 781.70]
MISAVLLIIITLFRKSVGVFIVTGCGMDLFINIVLTCLGYFPGHIHAYYLEYVYYKRREESSRGFYDNNRAPAIYSDRVQTGGRGYGTIAAPT